MAIAPELIKGFSGLWLWLVSRLAMESKESEQTSKLITFSILLIGESSSAQSNVTALTML